MIILKNGSRKTDFPTALLNHLSLSPGTGGLGGRSALSLFDFETVRDDLLAAGYVPMKCARVDHFSPKPRMPLWYNSPCQIELAGIVQW